MSKLTPKQENFCVLFVKYGDATKAYKEAYKCKNLVTCKTNGYKNLQKHTIKERLKELTQDTKKKNIADAEEVLVFLTRVMRGQEKDQFGLDLTMSDRLKAAESLGKRYRAFEKVDEKLEELRRRKLELENKKLEKELEGENGENMKVPVFVDDIGDDNNES